MEVRMVQEILSPSVQHGEKADLRAEVLTIARDGQQGFGGGTEEDAVNDLRVIERDGGDLFRDRENHVEILHRQQFGGALLEPFSPVAVLTLGAVPVPAGVIADALVIAVAAFFDVAAERGGAANFDGAHGAQLLTEHGVRFPIGAAVPAKNVSQLKGWPRHQRAAVFASRAA
jgi:hypothetical protein